MATLPDPKTVPADSVSGYVTLVEKFVELQKETDKAYSAMMDYYVEMMKDYEGDADDSTESVSSDR